MISDEFQIQTCGAKYSVANFLSIPQRQCMFDVKLLVGDTDKVVLIVVRRDLKVVGKSYLAFSTFLLQILCFGIVFLDACFDFRKWFPSEWSESRAFVVSLKWVYMRNLDQTAVMNGWWFVFSYFCTLLRWCHRLCKKEIPSVMYRNWSQQQDHTHFQPFPEITDSVCRHFVLS